MRIRCWVLGVLLFSAPSAAGMHKCVDPDGNVTYSQTACEESAGAPLRGGGGRGAAGAAPRSSAGAGEGAEGDVLCGRVRDYALELAWAMQRGVGVDRALAILGGRGVSGRVSDIVGDDVLEIISQVYALAGRGTVEPARIADVVMRQCLQGRIDFERGAPGGAEGLRRTAGTGIVLNPQGMVLTADRLIADCGRLRIHLDGAWYNARLLRRDPPRDMAILVANGLYGRPAVFALGEASSRGALSAMVLPLRGVLTGEVSMEDADAGPAPQSGAGASLSTIAAAVPDGSTVAGIDADADADAPLPLALSPGPAQAGAPLLDSAGLVAGMVLSAADDDTAPRFMPAPALRRFLNGADIAHYSAVGLGKLTRQELRRRAEGFTAHVECLP